MKVLIIDYGMGNLGSIFRALEEVGANPVISDNPDLIEEFKHIILPGVGSFSAGVKNLKEKGLYKKLKEISNNKNSKLLGICLGMQLLADCGYEGDFQEGLGLIKGKVEKLKSTKNEKIPHVGWNEVHHKKKDFLLNGIASGTDFYFVHSFQFIPENKENIIAKTPYCNDFVSIIKKDNVMGVQFHPEKSQIFGLKLLKNFIECESC